MSRKITNESVIAFLRRTPFKKSNMEVENDGGVTYLKLHGNKIAAINSKNEMWVSNAGWSSNTTKERLNGLPGVRVHQKNFQWYLNGEKWDGEPVYVTKRPY
jgi:hypothetical protein